jgi:hypothetical protein
MRGRLEIVVAVVAFAYLVFILTLVRRRQLREKYALLWLAVGVATIFASLARGALDRVAVALGFSYGPSALFLFSTLFLMAVVAHLSWEVSRLEDKTRRLAEEIALSRPQPPMEIDLSTGDAPDPASRQPLGPTGPEGDRN